MQQEPATNSPTTHSDKTPAHDHLIKMLQYDWGLEMDGVDMYQALADRERIPERKAIFTQLSAVERKHADGWAKRLRELGAEVPATHSGKAHATRIADTPGGMQEIIKAIEAEERRDVANYLRQMRVFEDEETKALLREVILDEFAHAHVLNRLYAQCSGRSTLDYLMRRQRQGTGSWIGDAVYGINDGLGSIFGIVSGVSGATLGNSKFVLLAGVAGMVASALSMGSGAYLAAKSEREIYEAELQHEREALKENPEAALEELAIFYQLKGVPEEEADKLAAILAKDPEQFLKTMAAEKLKLTEDALANPITSAVSGSISTAIGAFIPIVPFFFLSGVPAVVAAALISLAAHFAVGAAKSLVTVRSWWSSGLEMTVVGTVEGVVTYVIGIGLGHLGT
ncbi:MAG TPA: VIT1/CCC1 transporter family protein [Chthonomonadaceae bacterium]|nr:VIT1/CCC1 transporter family protein [Chthonomonadaceae bacterium]